MLNNQNSSKWYVSWFDSPYYHILYKERDFNEAKDFIAKLFKHLSPDLNAKILDIACGKGRHAFQMNSLGYYVDAFDLSEKSINAAKEKENEKLHFYINDIRKPLKLDYYDYAFNLFTSFGYFESEDDNYKAIKAISSSLKNDAIFVLDFMNANKIVKSLIKQEIKIVDNIKFDISRDFINGFIFKHISFVAEDKSYNFSEKVKAISLADFQNYFASAELNMIATFGDYNLSPFNIDNSDRLIMVLKK